MCFFVVVVVVAKHYNFNTKCKANIVKKCGKKLMSKVVKKTWRIFFLYLQKFCHKQVT